MFGIFVHSTNGAGYSSPDVKRHNDVSDSWQEFTTSLKACLDDDMDLSDVQSNRVFLSDSVDDMCLACFEVDAESALIEIRPDSNTITLIACGDRNEIMSIFAHNAIGLDLEDVDTSNDTCISGHLKCGDFYHLQIV